MMLKTEGLLLSAKDTPTVDRNNVTAICEFYGLDLQQVRICDNRTRFHLSFCFATLQSDLIT